jgi:hypothetical protein
MKSNASGAVRPQEKAARQMAAKITRAFIS